MDDLLAAPDFAWTLRLRRGGPGSFFARQQNPSPLLKRRNTWLDRSPELCFALAAGFQSLVEDAWNQAKDWGQLGEESEPTLESIGRHWEADFLLLDSATSVVAGGCVCFPSSWSLQESTGKTLDEVHGIAPGLTEQIGDKIHRFLMRLPRGQVFLRENWGLTRTDHLNYHPELDRPRIEGAVPLDTVYLRIEHQAFVRLPGGVLLGLRIDPVSVEEVVGQAPETARRLAGQLATMPDDVARYKGLREAVRWMPEAILGALRDRGDDRPSP